MSEEIVVVILGSRTYALTCDQAIELLKQRKNSREFNIGEYAVIRDDADTRLPAGAVVKIIGKGIMREYVVVTANGLTGAVCRHELDEVTPEHLDEIRKFKE